MKKIAASIERQIRLHPEQWLVLEKAFVEDNDSAESSTGDPRAVS
jgi:hypothetical protein